MGTPHILSMAPLQGSLELIGEAGIDAIRKKSLALTIYMLELINSELQGFGFSVITPLPEDKRGGHIAIAHTDAARICKSLKKNGIIPDFRPPNIIRLAPSPLYTSFLDVFTVIKTIRKIMVSKEYERFENIREVVA